MRSLHLVRAEGGWRATLDVVGEDEATVDAERRRCPEAWAAEQVTDGGITAMGALPDRYAP